MNTAVSVTNHPNDETLAAFVDGRLDAAAREEVMAHIVDCAECRDVVLLSTEIAAAETPSNVVRPRFRPRVLAAIAAAAAAIVVVFAITPVRERILGPGAMSEVASLAKAKERRPSAARLSLNVPYKPPKQTFRGGNDVPEPVTIDDYQAQVAAANAEERAHKAPSVENLHALGLAKMFEGKHREAVLALEQAVAKAEAPSALLLSDLAAAYLGDGQDKRAEVTARRSLQIEPTPAALWNRALALHRLGQDREAEAAWRQYLKIDPNSEWSEEARQDFLSRY